MEVQIISKEIIKPSSPTPYHLRTYKLSLLDKLAPVLYFPIILFYPSRTSKSTFEISDKLKKSLSETLTQYYPFAGRVKDEFSIECDDYGATFIEAHVANDMSEILQQPEIDLLESLQPCRCKPREQLTTQVAVQVNYFNCGRYAICVCFWHLIIDAAAASNFIKNWASIAYCGSNDIKDVIFDCTSIFPPQDSSGFFDEFFNETENSSMEIIRKRLTFDGTKIAALREKIGNHSTRFEAVSALILGAVSMMARQSDEPPPKRLVTAITVNLRNRMNPPLPPQCIGNIFQAITLDLLIEKMIDCKSIAGKLHESIKMMNDKFANELRAGNKFLSFLRNEAEGCSNDDKSRKFLITSWCRMPFYEADFGWGKPMWVTTTFRYIDTVILLDTCDGKGIEALVGLSKEDAAKFERDPGILALASFNPPISI